MSRPQPTSRHQENLTLLAFRGIPQPFEVVLDGLLVLVGEAAGQVLEDALPLLLGQRAPLGRDRLETFRIDLAGTAVVGDLAVGHRTARIRTTCRRTAGAPVGSGATVGSGPFAAVLQLLDELVEAVDDV